jgi:enoyl-CoA hydratase/carnithine racemase
MPDSHSLLLYDVSDHIATMVINRPEQRNAIDSATARAMRSAMDRFEADAEAWVGILTGAGDRAFCAGMDLKAFAAGEGPDLIDSKSGSRGRLRDRAGLRPGGGGGKCAARAA